MKNDKLSKLVEEIQSEIDQIGDPSDETRALMEKIENLLFKALKDTKDSGAYHLTYDSDEVATCQVLKAEMGVFYNKHKNKYPVPMYTDFLRYWSQPNARGIPAWYTEKSKPRGRFHLPGRLATWFKNQKDRERGKLPEKVPVAAIPDRLKTKLV